MRIALGLIIFSSVIWACKDTEFFVPKPRMYPKVDYPTKAYQDFSISGCPLTFNIPTYFGYSKDTFAMDKSINKCWFDLECLPLNAYLHLSYLPVENRKHFDQLVGDAFELADKHNIKANYRDERKINYPEKRVHGLLFEIDGPVATPLQFFVTDTSSHFFRGSLYFKSRVDRDSLAPVYNYLKEDVLHLIDNFSWQ